MANSGVIGKRSRDGQGRIGLGEKFVQTQFPVPTITGFSVDGLDDTALDIAGGQTVVITGTNFVAGATVIVGGVTIGAVTFVDSTTLTFTSEAKSSGTYNLFVVNPNGGTAILTPGLIYSGLPTFTTGAGSLGSYYETTAVSEVIEAEEDTDTITYAISSGSLPTGVTLASNGILTGTAPVENSSTTYTFTVEATDEELQSSTRQFSLTINADVVTWVSPEEGSISLDGDEAMSALNLSATSAAGHNVDYAVDVLPTGVTLTNGQVTGTPTTQETVASTFTATAATTGRTSTRTVTFVVSLGDVYFKDTSLLLAADTNTFITDSSDNLLTLVPSGDVRPSAFSPYDQNWSNYFDGTGDYLSVPDNESLDGFTGDFTVEFWVNFSSTSAGVPLSKGWNGSTFSPYLFLLSSGNLLFYASAGGSWNISNGATLITSVKTNTWYHVAVSRSGSTLYRFVNGSLIGTATTTSTFLNSTDTLTVGSSVGGYTPMTGYVSNVRVVKGTAVYTSNFTPPTAPLTAISGTSLLTCQSNRFVDNSTNNFTITRNGDVKVQSFSPFTDIDTGGSAAFDGNGDFVTITANSALDFGTGNFTFETWIFIPPGGSGAGQLLTLQPTSGSNFFQWFVGNSDGTTAWGINNVGNFNTSGAIPRGTWTHLALTREANTLRQFTNGSKTYENTNFTYTIGSSNQNAFIGRDTGQYGNFLNAVLSNFRIVKGTALYTANFTAPTEPLTAVANTSLLTFQSRISYNNSQPIDESGIKNVILRNGNASVGSFSPHVPTGWSAYFSGYGTAQSISCTTNSSLNLDGDFTIEAWINYNTVANNRAILYIGSTALTVATGGILSLTLVGSWDQTVAPSGSISAGRWFHVVVQRISNTLSSHINGVYQSSYTSTRSNTLGGTGVIFKIGTNHDLVIPEGYITNVRVIKGEAIYGTSNFTPSTTPLENTSNTSFLWRGGPTLKDESYNNFTLSKVDTVQITPFSPFKPHTVTPKSYGVYFDAVGGDYITTPSSSAFGFGTGDFTLECWFLLATGATYLWLFDFRQSTASLAVPALYADGSNLAYYVSGSIRITYPTSNITRDRWHHIAVVRNSGTTTIYLDGTAVGTPWSDSTNYIDTIFKIGKNESTVFGGPMYVSNARVVKGIAVYTGNFTPPTEPLTKTQNSGTNIAAITNSSNVSILTLQSPTIIDNSDNAFAITITGTNNDPKPTKFNPFGETVTSGVQYSPTTHGGSLYFDGTADVFYTATSVPAIGTSIFTVDFWFYLKEYGTNKRLFLLGVSGTNGILIGRDSDSSTLKVSISATGDTIVLSSTSSTIVPINQWTHLAVVREGTSSNQTKLYINGVLTLTGTSTASVSANRIQVGGLPPDHSTAYSINGYISEPRLTVGSALYTSNFVPPSIPASRVAGTTFLLGSTNAAIQDSTGRNVLETVGNARTLPESPYRLNKSVYFDGSGDYLSIPNTNSEFTFGTGDFCVEGWVYLLNNSVRKTFYSGATNGSLDIQLNVPDTVAGIGVGLSNTSYNVIAPTGTLSLSRWYHIAVSRQSGTLRVFLDGQLVSSTSNSENYGANGGSAIVGVSNPNSGAVHFFDGYISGFRVVKGSAVYTSAFTPPTSPLTAISGTSLLTCQSYNFKDNSTNNLTINRNGDAKVTSRGPFTETQTSDNAMYFDGSGDVISVGSLATPLPILKFNYDDFTIEFWVYFNNVSSRQSIINSGWGSTGYGTEGGITLDIAGITAGKLSLALGTVNSGAFSYTSTGSVTTSTWYHMALVRNGTNLRLYINGSYLNGFDTIFGSATLKMLNMGFYRVGAYDNNTFYFNGYIDGLRFTKGVARYTSNFTPPISPHKLK